MLKRKLLIGIGWMEVLRGSTRIVDFFKIALVARFLTPEEFGLFAIVTTTVGLLESFSQTGINFAFIHFKLKIHKVFKTIVVINIVRGIVLSLFMIGISWFLSVFYYSEILLGLLLIAAIIPFMKGFQNPSTILFYQNLKFHKEFLFRFVPSIIGAFISVWFAFITRSAYGLAYGLVVTTLLETLFSYFIEKQYFQSKFDIKYIKQTLSYTKWLTLSGGVSYLTNQIDNLFVGRFFNLSILGIYDLAFKLASICYTEITDVISRVLFPALSKIKNDKNALKRYYIKTTLFLFLPATIATVIFIFASETILTLAFGEQWTAASSILQILSLYGFIRTVNGPIGPLLLTLGKTKIISIADTLNFILIIIFIFPFSILWGINGVAWTIVFSYIIVQPILITSVYKFLKT